EAMSADDLREVQDRVNAAIWANLPVRVEVKSYSEDVAEGAMALFGEKYGDLVRVVNIGDWSKELCGGTHGDATGSIGLLVITTDDPDYLEIATDQVKARLDRGIVIFGTVVGDKAAYSLGVTKNLNDEGFSAGTLLKEALQESHAGKGGGRPWFARGGGEDAS